jgi:RHS repeat-associated protein
VLWLTTLFLLHAKSYYQSTTTYNNANATPLTVNDILNSFLGAPDNAGVAGKGANLTTLQSSNIGQNFSNFIRGANGTSSTVAKAFINYIFFDEQMKYVAGNFSQVGASGTVKNHFITDLQMQNIPATKSGYVYIYCSNESNTNVFFDNLQVFHTRSPILEETHYYPFGLVMNGISSKAANTLENKYKNTGKELQSKEFSDGSGLELYDFWARQQDVQIGRWTTVDPMATRMYQWSPYNYCLNNSIRYFDPNGMLPADILEPNADRRAPIERDLDKSSNFDPLRSETESKRPYWGSNQGMTELTEQDDDWMVRNNGDLVLMKRTNDKEHRFFNEDGEILLGTIKAGETNARYSWNIWGWQEDLNFISVALSYSKNLFEYEDMIERGKQLGFGTTSTGRQYVEYYHDLGKQIRFEDKAMLFAPNPMAKFRVGSVMKAVTTANTGQGGGMFTRSIRVLYDVANETPSNKGIKVRSLFDLWRGTISTIASWK